MKYIILVFISFVLGYILGGGLGFSVNSDFEKQIRQWTECKQKEFIQKTKNTIKEQIQKEVNKQLGKDMGKNGININSLDLDNMKIKTQDIQK